MRAAREGEVVNLGQPIVIITDLGDTWVRAAVPETQADHIALGDKLKARLPSGEIVPGKIIFKAPEADFATQRDVNRRKRDIKAIALKLAVENTKKTMVPGMTAEILVPWSKVGRPLMAPAAIQVIDIVKRFGNFTAVNGVSFDVAEGEIFGFWGRTAPANPR